MAGWYENFVSVLRWARENPHVFDAVAVHMGYLAEDEAEEFVRRRDAGQEDAWRVSRELWASDPSQPRINPDELIPITAQSGSDVARNGVKSAPN